MTAALPYAQQLAAELGDDWTAVDDSPRFHGSALLTGPQGERVSVRHGSDSYQLRPGRVQFMALMPPELSEHRYGRNTADITVAAAKPAAVVASKRDSDAQEAERAALVDAAAKVLAPLGEVNVWDRNDRHHGGPSGTLSVGRYDDPVQIELVVDRDYRSGSWQPTAKATVRVHRDLLPRLAAALATLADEATP